ncbi:MAG: O-methyltransferase [Chloroflexi bacterium]|nr:O-methyltransferase [Chloroflexota bacterium]
MDLYNPLIPPYLDGLVPPRPKEMQKMEAYAKEHGFPIIGPASGYLCYQIARMINAKKIFELGSGYGYSTAWFAKAVVENGGGQVHHVVWDEELSKMAQKHLGELGYTDVIKYTVGEAVQTLRDSEDAYDLIFSDIDKEGYPDSLHVIENKLRSGGVLIVDNLLWNGDIFDKQDRSKATLAIRRFTQMMSESKTWISSIVPIRDGVLVALKK